MLYYGYIEDFINELRSNGRYAFALEEVRKKYKQSDEAIKKALQRLKEKKEIASVRKEFYVIVPPEYRSKGMLPPSLFVAELMKFLGRTYYVGLLNAAAYYGAAHQQPQEFSVVTNKPTLRAISNNSLKINFYIKKDWADEDIVQRKVETGYFNISSPELTALDLVMFFDEVGGFNRITTVLEELTERINAQKLVATAKRFHQVSTIQRLGYLLDDVLHNEELSKPLAGLVKSMRCYPTLLRPQKEKPLNKITGNIWKVIPNIEVETDL